MRRVNSLSTWHGLSTQINAAPLQVEKAEATLRSLLRLAPQEDARVRRLPNGEAAVELTASRLAALQQATRDGVAARLIALGFASVAFREFRSGSVATRP